MKCTKPLNILHSHKTQLNGRWPYLLYFSFRSILMVTSVKRKTLVWHTSKNMFMFFLAVKCSKFTAGTVCFCCKSKMYSNQHKKAVCFNEKRPSKFAQKTHPYLHFWSFWEFNENEWVFQSWTFLSSKQIRISSLPKAFFDI